MNVLSVYQPAIHDKEKMMAMVMTQKDPKQFIEDEFKAAMLRWMNEEGTTSYNETFRDFKARTLDTIQDIITTARREKHKEVIAVTSGGVISLYMTILNDMPLTRIDPSSISTSPIPPSRPCSSTTKKLRSAITITSVTCPKTWLLLCKGCPLSLILSFHYFSKKARLKSVELKQEIHGYIEQADDKILQAIKTLVKLSIEQIQLSKGQKNELDKRKKAHLAGQSKSYTWEQTEKMLKGKRK
jgi:hypothetical protein